MTTVSDGSAGVTSRQSYDPWGNQLSGPQLENGFLGAYQRTTDPTTGLLQMGARPYAPTLGQFLSEDPVLGAEGSGQSADRYPYVWDNPLNRYDLNGRFSLPSISLPSISLPSVNACGSIGIAHGCIGTSGVQACSDVIVTGCIDQGDVASAAGAAGGDVASAAGAAGGYVADQFGRAAQDFSKLLRNCGTLCDVLTGNAGSCAQGATGFGIPILAARLSRFLPSPPLRYALGLGCAIDVGAHKALGS